MNKDAKAEAEGTHIASGLALAARIKGEDAADTRLLRKMSKDAERYISSFSWCGSVIDSYFGGGVGGIFAVFFFHIHPSRRGISPWIWIMVGDIPSAYLPLDDCNSPAEAFEAYILGMSKWVEHARKGKTGTARHGVPPVNVPATPEWAEKLSKRLHGLTIAIRPFFQLAGDKDTRLGARETGSGRRRTEILQRTSKCKNAGWNGWNRS